MYGPQRGFAQSQYFDQQATALAGMLANASDINLTDSAFVGNVPADTGLVAGIGVQVLPTTVSNRAGVNYDIVVPPLASATDADFAGVVVRNQVMRTNSNGEACMFTNDMANYARRGRAGSRIWVKLVAGTAVPNGKVYWVVRDTAGTGKQIGAFSAEAISGNVTPTSATLTGGTIDLTALKSIADGGIDIAIDDEDATTITGLDFSNVETLADVAVVLNAELTGATATVKGNGITITSATTGASSTLSFASAPTSGTSTNASAALGLTEASGGTLVQGSTGESYDTVELSYARFLDTFTVSGSVANDIALIELL